MSNTIPERRKVIAFAQFRQRQRDPDPIVIDFGDDEIEIPATMPATVMLDLMAFMEEHGADAELSEMPANLALGMLNDIVGDETLQAMVRKHKLTMTEFYWLLGQIMDRYRGDVEQADGLGKRQPERSASTSSKNGN
jgi:hypothetical protein